MLHTGGSLHEGRFEGGGAGCGVRGGVLGLRVRYFIIILMYAQYLMVFLTHQRYNAAEKGPLELGKILLAHGANPNQAIGAMPIDAMNASPNSLYSNESNGYGSDAGTTPLMTAVRKNRTAWVKLLLENGADQRQVRGSTRPLHTASFTGVRRLLFLY